MERIIRALVREHAKELERDLEQFYHANMYLLQSNKPEDISLFISKGFDKIFKALRDLING